MGIGEQYMIISFVIAIIFIVLIVQSIVISWIHKTVPWALFAIGWLIIGTRQVYATFKVPLALEKARARGIELQPIDLEGWLLISSGIAAGVIFIVAHDILRRHYRRIGI